VKDLLLHMLGDDESFVYLAAVHALSRVVDMNRKLLIPSLLEIFSGRNTTPMSLKIRAALGEVLSLSLRRARDLAPFFVPTIVSECLRICRQRVYLPHSTSGEIDGIDANLSQMKIQIPTLTTAEVEEKSDAEIGEMNRVIDTYSNAADLIYFRQSAYSLLSEAMACGGWTATKYLNDTLDLALGTLLLEHNHRTSRATSASGDTPPGVPHQENMIMRRSSVFLVKYILLTLKEKLFQLSNPSSGNNLKLIKRMLTICCRDDDQVVSYQAQRGLYILEELVKQQFVPNDDIPKIRILG
jgi:hypothetical protein